MKKLLKLILVVILSVAAIGCGSSDDRRKFQDAEKPQSGDKAGGEPKPEK